MPRKKIKILFQVRKQRKKKTTPTLATSKCYKIYIKNVSSSFFPFSRPFFLQSFSTKWFPIAVYESCEISLKYLVSFRRDFKINLWGVCSLISAQKIVLRFLWMYLKLQGKRFLIFFWKTFQKFFWLFQHQNISKYLLTNLQQFVPIELSSSNFSFYQKNRSNHQNS